MRDPTYHAWCSSMANLVRYRMKAMEISLEDLAGMSGLPFGYLKEIVEGRFYPSRRSRLMMQKALGCSLEFVQPKRTP